MNEQAKANALVSEDWVNIRVRPYELLERGVDGCQYALTDKHFLDFLHLLKILPTTRYKFETSVKHFLKITTVFYSIISFLANDS